MPEVGKRYKAVNAVGTEVRGMVTAEVYGCIFFGNVIGDIHHLWVLKGGWTFTEIEDNS